MNTERLCTYANEARLFLEWHARVLVSRPRGHVTWGVRKGGAGWWSIPQLHRPPSGIRSNGTGAAPAATLQASRSYRTTPSCFFFLLFPLHFYSYNSLWDNCNYLLLCNDFMLNLWLGLTSSALGCLAPAAMESPTRSHPQPTPPTAPSSRHTHTLTHWHRGCKQQLTHTHTLAPCVAELTVVKRKKKSKETQR